MLNLAINNLVQGFYISNSNLTYLNFMIKVNPADRRDIVGKIEYRKFKNTLQKIWV